MSLSSLIVQREIATIREIEEALARQVLYGGDFVTNLLEVSRIEESALMPVVAESFNLPVGPAGELPKIPETAVRLVAAEVASERSFAPLEVGTSLVVAVAEPLSRDAEQELTFALALPIEQRITPLFRIRQALARDYGIPIDKRTARLITKVVHKGPRIASTFPPPLESQPHLQRALPGRPPSIMPPPVASVPAPRTSSSPQGTFVRKAEAPPARPAKRRRGPLTMDVAQNELEASAERDVIFDLLFEFARQFFDYTALFTVHGEIAEGRDAFGDGASRDKVARVGVPLDLANLLSKARDEKRPIRSKPSLEGLDPVLMADLGREGTTECVALPIIVRTRVVALLFGDGGPSGVDLDGLRQVSELIDSAANAFERVIMRRKLKGGGEEGGVAAAQRKAQDSIAPPPTQVSAPPQTGVTPEIVGVGRQPKERPSVEEMAAPIRELMAEPMSRVAMTTREPTPQTMITVDPSSVRSDRPPPANLLAVRRPSGAPIPREEPDSTNIIATAIIQETQARRPVLRGRRRLDHALLRQLDRGLRKVRRRVVRRERSRGSLKRAEAPALEFGSPQIPSVISENTFGGDAIERELLAQIQGQSAVTGVGVGQHPPGASTAPSEGSAPTTTRDPDPALPWSREPSSPPYVHPWAREPNLATAAGSLQSASDALALSASDALAQSEAFSQPPYSPRAESPPPMRAAPITDMSPQAILPINTAPITPITEHVPDPPSLDLKSQPIQMKVRVGETPSAPFGTVTLVEGQLPGAAQEAVKRVASGTLSSRNDSEVMRAREAAMRAMVDDAETPIAPMVGMPAPDPDETPAMPPVNFDQETPSAGNVDPILALSHRKGMPPVVPSQPEPKPMPPSEQQVSVPAHKPPSSRSDHSRILPSVIVDVSSEYVTLVERVLRGPDEEAETDLLRAGGYAMPAIMAKFPGPIGIEPERLQQGTLPRVAECGPVIRLVASQRRTALPFVLSHIEALEIDRRFWATYLLTELVYPDAIDPAIGRVFDADTRVRRAARAAIRALAEAHPVAVVDRLGDVVKDERESWSRRVQAVDALGETREALAVPVLLPLLLDDSQAEIQSAARQALVMIARQDFASDADKWTSWWAENKSRHRLEWLIDSLMHDQRALRAAASEELRAITKEYFAYYDDLPKRERERAQSRYREWWKTSAESVSAEPPHAARNQRCRRLRLSTSGA